MNNDEFDISVELKEFKSQLKQWLAIDEEISKYEGKIKDLKNLKNKIYNHKSLFYGES